MALDQRIVDLAQKLHIPYVAAAELWIKMQRPDCCCDGAAYEQKVHPFLVHSECPVHNPTYGFLISTQLTPVDTPTNGV